MQINLFDKEGRITTSSVFFSYKILKIFKTKRLNEVSIFRLSKFLKDIDESADTRQLFYGLMFLKMAGIISMDGVNVRIIDQDA